MLRLSQNTRQASPRHQERRSLNARPALGSHQASFKTIVRDDRRHAPLPLLTDNFLKVSIETPRYLQDLELVLQRFDSILFESRYTVMEKTFFKRFQILSRQSLLQQYQLDDHRRWIHRHKKK